jgi:hypothetical protein
MLLLLLYTFLDLNYDSVIIGSVESSVKFIKSDKISQYSKDQPVNVVYGNYRCLLWGQYETHKYTLWAECIILVFKVVGTHTAITTGI